METLKKQAAEENKKLEKRKGEIDNELAEIQPLVEEAKAAVGNIKNETLGEIRALRAPPDVIRDILEGVLRLMGIFDTSWVSMKRRVIIGEKGVLTCKANMMHRNLLHCGIEMLMYRK